ncbi:MAG: protoporphyrinogen oxidase [Bacteroidetes bacterium]|jgi:oxygen-dependent protoporphyrinogen oxidase|nr:protoporphyrinogen oxidase [Bacteroidota bacterium]
MTSIAIVGGGIAGLTAAYQLQRRGLDVLVLEARDEAGGAIRSEQAGPFLVEYGPNSLRASTPLLEDMIDALGLADQVVEAQPAAKNRYIVRDGHLVALPTSPPGLLTTKAFSLRGKLRLLAEPFVAPRTVDGAESVADFVQRRLGREALNYGANPFVAGIFAGDPEALSVEHAFPALHTLEAEHGSLLKGQFRRARARKDAPPPKARYGLFSFRDGLQTLPRALADALGDALHTGTRVTRLSPDDGGGWTLTTQTDAAQATHRVDAVLSTVPLHNLPALLSGLAVDLAPLEGVPYPPVSVYHLGYHATDVGHPLDGFGVLVPEVEDDLHILGTIFSSTLFPNRAPDDYVLLTTLVGGSRHPDLARADLDTIWATVTHDLQALLDVHGPPVFDALYRWEQAIPQYVLGYGAIKDLLTRLETAHAGLFLAGNFRQGIAVPDAMASAAKAAERIAEYLGA